jgi:hypothetical protein
MNCSFARHREPKKRHSVGHSGSVLNFKEKVESLQQCLALNRQASKARMETRLLLMKAKIQCRATNLS